MSADSVNNPNAALADIGAQPRNPSDSEPSWFRNMLETQRRKLPIAGPSNPHSPGKYIASTSSSASDNSMSLDTNSPLGTGDNNPPSDATTDPNITRLQSTVQTLLRSSAVHDRKQRMWAKKWKRERRLRKQMQAEINDLKRIVFGNDNFDKESETLPEEEHRGQWTLQLISPAWRPQWTAPDPRTRRN